MRFARDKHGNLLWVERLWNALPHWARWRFGPLFPARRIILPKRWGTIDEFGFDHDHADPIHTGRVGCRACVLRLNAQASGRSPLGYEAGRRWEME